MTDFDTDRSILDSSDGPDQSAFGVHAIIELYGCPFVLLNDESYIRRVIQQASAAAKTHLLNLTSHRFSPQGITALGLLAESHISIHTWPEAGYAAADLFTCGDKISSIDASRKITELLKADRHSVRYLTRGEQMMKSKKV